MSDLIERQAAIDVLAAMQGRCTSKAALIQNSKIWQQIKDLPSVQPVAKDINVSCKDAISRQVAIDALEKIPVREFKKTDGLLDALISIGQVYRALKQLPPVQPEPQWIPCRETVDIPDHEILACDKYGEEMFGYLSYEDDQWLCVSDDCMMYDPIAWREKLEPYRGGR